MSTDYIGRFFFFIFGVGVAIGVGVSVGAIVVSGVPVGCVAGDMLSGVVGDIVVGGVVPGELGMVGDIVVGGVPGAVVWATAAPDRAIAAMPVKVTRRMIYPFPEIDHELGSGI